ncbi:MAG: hypothetical protein IK130_09000, partial [Oscillospiraceae bacterium]|nr:hypothetical protein [Oscillospiraceae bacterium]
MAKKQLTKEEEAQLRKIAEKFSAAKAEAEKASKAKMNAEQKEFVEWRSYYNSIQGIKLGQQMTAAFEQGMKPSDFIMKHLSFLFETGYVSERYRENLLAAADALPERQYS